MAPATTAALRVDDVHKSFVSGRRQITALRGVTFSAPAGQVTGLIGPDGAGKTTLMRIVTGLLSADQGRAQVLGIDVAQQPRRVQAAVGYMPQRFGLYEDLSVQENLDLYADLQGVAAASRTERYQELMRLTGLEPFLSRLAGRLSGGMKQKLGLACTLVQTPQLLVLDEPTVGVDPVSRRELWAIVARAVEEQGLSVLLSTAYLDEAERCDSVVLLHQGEVIGRGTPASFREQLRGRTFSCRARDLGARALQARLADLPGIIDAVIQAESVRMVVAADVEATPANLLPEIAGGEVEAVAPRFEDAFVAILRARDPAPASRPSRAQPAARSDGGAGPAIAVEHAQRRFGDFYAVRDISFEVRRGEIFGLLGANGAGKSTTFRMLCGLLPASAGQLLVAGVDLRTAAAAARARIGYMSQKFSLYGQLSVRQNVAFFSRAYGLAGRHRAETVAATLTDFELDDLADARSQDLALGYKQRLALACALMHDPDILFLDEPTSGVDPLARRGFWRRINDLAERGVTIMVTTHFMEEADYCDRVAIMAAGEILTLGSPTAIKAAAATAERSAPTMEDAFMELIEDRARRGVSA